MTNDQRLTTNDQPVNERQYHDRFYGADAERIFSSPLYRALLDLHARFLLDVTPAAASSRILSVGCGDGRREIAIAPAVGHIVGIDLSPVAIDKARQRARDLGAGNVEFRVGDVAELGSEPAAAFDAVWCGGVLHHLGDAQIAALQRTIRALLRPGGSFVSIDPNARRAVNLFKPLFRRQYARYHSDGERELQPTQVAAMLQSAGYERIEVRFTDAFISPLAWVWPGAPAPLAPILARIDRLATRMPVIAQLSSGFAVVGRNGHRP